MADLLLTEHGRAELPGTTFGARGEGHLRLAVTAPVPEGAAARLVRGVESVIDQHHPES